MSKILHITSGDALTSKLEKLNIEGEIITWREMLSEGKTIADVGSEPFWKVRYQFLNKAYKITKRAFVDLNLKEYKALCNHKKEEEIVLWFEQSLFSQINMIALISWLKKHRKNRKVSLIHYAEANKKGISAPLSELSNKKLLQLYKNRIELSQDDIEYADYIWQLYCGDNPIRIETFTQFNSSQFEYLPEVMKAHILRFPTVKNGLNNIENQLLETVAQNDFQSREKLISHLLKNQGIYGYGEAQFLKVTEALKPLFKSFNPVQLNKQGLAVLKKSTNYYPIIKNNDTYLGGAPKYGFLYHEDTHKLLKL
ncbi:DUF1835 domain-containing protein [Leptobacterium sp. I13]|uniref:DUF1835 domain-containing protein n=1 Tax=Leptobacterium meishanense TaxID=3128904 RepID=UPI0030ED8379